MMKYKTLLLFLVFVLSTIDHTNGGKISSGRSSFGRGSSSHRTSSGRGSSRTTGSYGTSSTNYGSGSSHKSQTLSHAPSLSHRPIGFGTSGGSSVPRPVGTSGGGSVPYPVGTSGGSSVPRPVGTSHGQNKDINTHFLSAEGGGATRPAQTKPPQTSFGNSYPIAPIPNTGGKPGVTTESKQTSASLQPSAPNEHVIKPATSTFQNQAGNTLNPLGHPNGGQTNPAWSNPHLGTNYGATSQAQRPWSNPHLTPNQPIPPGSQPPPYGFNVHPQTHSSGVPSYPSQPHIGGHPAYPHTVSPNVPWSSSSSYTPMHQPSAMPFGNPYSLHPAGNTYSSPGSPYYPQQSQHVLAQPAMQPFVPGQTIVLGQQDSGRGFGQMVKEALVFSTINAGVNRLINPHTHTYVESKPDSSPATTTHITYNNQYFNAPPGVNSTGNPASVPASVPFDNYSNGGYVPNAGPGNTFPLANGNMNPISTSNNRVFSPSETVGGGGGVTTGISTTGNIVAPPASSASSNQGNTSTNLNTTESTFSYRISDDDISKITEELFAKAPDMSKYIKLNLQNRSTSLNTSDEAKEPLLNVEPEILNYPSISVIRSLYDSYLHDFRKKLNRTLEIREHENLLIDTFLNTNVMGTAMQWLADRGFIDPDDFERKDVLRRIWFTIFSGSSCGFERVFASESYGTAIVGVQDWIYFEYEESLKRIDYMSYVDKLNLGNTASLLKLNFQMDGIARSNATIFVGTVPELEMSLYTICFYARPNNVCPVSLGGTKFNIYTHAFTYFGNDVIDLGLPLF